MGKKILTLMTKKVIEQVKYFKTKLLIVIDENGTRIIKGTN